LSHGEPKFAAPTLRMIQSTGEHLINGLTAPSARRRETSGHKVACRVHFKVRTRIVSESPHTSKTRHT